MFSRTRQMLVPSLVGSVAVLTFGCSSSPSVSQPPAQSVVLSTCVTSSKVPSITLSDMTPAPTVKVPAGSAIVVLVPPWGAFHDTDVEVADGTVLKEQCSVSLSDHSRRTILTALRPGATRLTATITPPTEAMMPAWQGIVTVVH